MSIHSLTWNGFGRSLCFAALAGGAYPLVALVAHPVLGATLALRLYLVAVLSFYIAGLGPRLSRSVIAGLLAGGLGLAVLLVAGRVSEVALGAALVLGVCRSGLLYGGQQGRSLVVEAVLLVGGLALARFLFAPGLLGVALAIWGFFLVQSVYFLVGGGARERSARSSGDPFEVARARALGLMEEDLG